MMSSRREVTPGAAAPPPGGRVSSGRVTAPPMLRVACPLSPLRSTPSSKFRHPLPRIALQEHLIRQPLGRDLVVELGLHEQLLVRPARDDLAVLEHHDVA